MPTHVLSSFSDVRSGVATALSGGSIFKVTSFGRIEVPRALRSPDGTAWKVAVADDGTVSATKIVPLEGDTWATAGGVWVSQFERGWVGSSIGASIDPGFTEPAVWVALRGYVIPAGGSVTVDTDGSDFDTVLRIYSSTSQTPTSLSDLTLVAENDEGPLGMTSEVTFVQDPLLYYWAGVFGYEGDSGIVIMHVR